MKTESYLDASVVRLILREAFLYQLDLVSPYPAREERPVLRSWVPIQVELSQEAPEAPHVYLACGMRRRFLPCQEDLWCTIVPRLDVHGLNIEVLIRHKDRRAHVAQFDLHRFHIFNQDIFWLQITVHYAVPLEEGQGPRGLQGYRPDLSQGDHGLDSLEGRQFLVVVSRDVGEEVTSLHPLEDHAIVALMLEFLEHPNNPLRVFGVSHS